MASLNRVLIMGNLGADPELRHTSSGTSVTTLNVATTHAYTDKDGNHQEATEWHRVVVWSKQAENCVQYLTKGRAVLVEGRLATRSWEDENGEKKYATEIIANTVQFLGSAKDGGKDHSDVGQAEAETQAVAKTSARSKTAAGAHAAANSGRKLKGVAEHLPF